MFQKFLTTWVWSLMVDFEVVHWFCKLFNDSVNYKHKLNAFYWFLFKITRHVFKLSDFNVK